MLAKLKRLRKAFYDGPDFLGVEPYSYNGYKSPTLTACLWLYAMMVRHFTMAGSMVFLCTGLVTMYAMFGLVMPIHILAFSLALLFTVNVVVGLFCRRRVMVCRHLPSHIAAGTSQAVLYDVRNDSSLPAWDVFLDSLPLPRGVRFTSGRPAFQALAPGEVSTARAYIQAERRGQYRLPAPRADTAFPFHLWRWGVTGSGDRLLTVYPAFHPLRTFELDTGLRYHAGGIALSSKVGNSMEFLGTREFRDGDDPRRLHWRSWARTSYPVVKEFCEEYLCHTALIVDTYRPRPYFWDRIIRPLDKPFEAVASLTAAIADFLSEQDYIVDLFAAGPNVYRFRGGRHLGFLDNILDVLACLEAHHGEPFAEFSDELIAEIAQISSAVFVLLTWNDVRRDLLHEMASVGITTRTFLITGASPPPDDLPDFVELIQAEDVLTGRCVSL
jgi:uncharacterized protein (DUF58 family)